MKELAQKISIFFLLKKDLNNFIETVSENGYHFRGLNLLEKDVLKGLILPNLTGQQATISEIIELKDELCNFAISEHDTSILNSVLNDIANRSNLPTSYGINLTAAYISFVELLNAKTNKTIGDKEFQYRIEIIFEIAKSYSDLMSSDNGLAEFIDEHY